MSNYQRDKLRELYAKLVEAGLIKKAEYTNETLSVYDIQMLKEFETLIKSPDDEDGRARSLIDDAIDSLRDARENLESALEELD